MVDVGSVVAGYRLVEAMGSGPFGRTFRAEDGTGRLATLKLLKPTFLGRVDGASAFERLRASINVHAQLAHPYLARVRAHVQEPEHQALGQIAEFLDGVPLSQMSIGAEVRNGQDPQGLANLLQCFEQLGDVLNWLHGQGMVHGNVKPSNVLVLPHHDEYHVKLLDLSWSAIGVAAVAKGPESYVSPEQYQGSVPTPASDQWALGTMLERVFTEGRHRLSLGVLPAALVHVVQQAVAEVPSRRFESVEALVLQLRQIRIDLLQSAGRPVSAPHGSATLPAGSVPPDLAEPLGPGVAAAELAPRSAEAPPLRRPELDMGGAFGVVPAGPSGDVLARAKIPSGGAHERSSTPEGELGAALGSSAGMVAPNALSDQVTKKAEAPPVSVEIPVVPDAEPEGAWARREQTLSGPYEAQPSAESGSSVRELYTRRRLRDSGEVNAVPSPIARGTVGVEDEAPEVESDHEDRVAVPYRRHDIGDVLGEGMADELLDAPAHDAPFDAFEGPTTGGARRPPVPRGDTVRGPTPVHIPPAPAVYDPARGEFQPPPARPDSPPQLAEEPLPTPELASMGPSAVPGVMPQVDTPSVLLVPAPVSRWAPRAAAAVVVVAAMGFGAWQVWGSRGAAAQPLIEGAGMVKRALTSTSAAPATSIEPALAPSSTETAKASVESQETPKAEADTSEVVMANSPVERSSLSAARPSPRRPPPPRAKLSPRPGKRRRPARPDPNRAPAPTPVPVEPPVLARPRPTEAPPLAPDPTPPVPADPIEALDAKAGAALERLAAEKEKAGATGRAEIACQGGAGPACLELGRARQVAGDTKASLRAFERACALGEGSGCLRAAGGYARTSEGRAKSTRLYEAACAARVAEGCHRAAMGHAGERAASLEAQACQLGRAASCSPDEG